MSITKINLQKKFYGTKGALNLLDEEFTEFNINSKLNEEFFSLYNNFFYDLGRNNHNHFLKNSTNYAYPEGFENERLLENKELENQLRNLQKQIDSKEKEHFFFKNNSFLILEGTPIIEERLSTTGPAIGPFYMQSGKKRLIKNLDIYFKLKTKTRKQSDILDQNFLIFLNQQALNGISSGPPITGTNDIYIDALEINIYPQTLDQYNNSPLDLLLGFNENIIRD